jgi:putative spermidine/putrescine transport system ATP-binding protein
MQADRSDIAAPGEPGAVMLSGLGRRFGNDWAVQPLDLSVARGEFLSLLGPSGCGKTTILRMIAGFLEPSCGSIRIDGQDVTDLPTERRGIGIVVQSYALFPSMNVFENVAFGLRVRRLPKQEITDRVQAALAQVGLSGFERRAPSQLSGGQRQRVALARAIVTEPALLLLDEPLSALDARIRAEMRAWLKELQHRLGITTVFVTHDQDEALSLSDRIVVMNAGRIEQCAPPRTIYDRPATEFVARFVGVANLIPARIEECGQVSAASFGTVSVDTGTCRRGDAVTLVLRPEALTLTPGGAGRLVSVDYTGAASLCRVELGDQTLSVAFDSSVPTPEAGAPVGLSIKPGAGYLMQKETPDADRR